MKIPFFYLMAGEIKILQPQNKYDKNRTYYDDESIRIKSIGGPAISVESLYLNGNDNRISFNFIDGKRSYNFSKFIDILKKLNEVTDV